VDQSKTVPRKNKMKLLLIDDDLSLNQVLEYQLTKHNFETVTALDGKTGLEKFKKTEFDVVVTDIQMPDVNGIEVLKEIRRLNPDVLVIIITAYGSVDNALEACRLGADDYLTKPFGIEQLLFIIEKSARLRNLQRENIRLQRELTEKYQFENMIAISPKMQTVLRMAMQAAASNATLLILGESGTGKELMAKAIHFNSPRKVKDLVIVNCPSIPENLIESELFGHAKGAFTGALKERKGKFELADGGTIFLDEIGDLGWEVQAKLLRVLQERTFERLGTSKEIKVDVRIIAATNKKIEEMMQKGEFREDLYYRLSVVPLIIPPLRERKEDIPYLIDFFLRKYTQGRSIKLDNDVFYLLENYNWPGNIRELENLMERLCVLNQKNYITKDDLPSTFLTEKTDLKNIPLEEIENLSFFQIEKKIIQDVLKRVNGNQTKAAKLLKIPRHILLYRMKKLQIK
jgi:DNA-binding NtrC family response regulator